MIEYHFKNEVPNYFLDNRDLTQFALRLKRRMKPDEEGVRLADEIKLFSKAINRVRFDEDLQSSHIIKTFKDFLSLAYPTDYYYAGYQIRGFNSILQMLKTNQKKCVVISAPTASGKSKVFIAPALFNAILNKGSAIIIYPRLSLMQDQLSSLLKIWTNIGDNRISIGVQRGGTGSSDYITINYGTQNKDSLLERKTKGGMNGISLKNIQCPNCGSTIWAPTGKSEIGKFSCQNKTCKLKNLDLFLSKESIIQNKPSILVTTVDSINALLYKKNFNDYLKKCDLIVFDEAHAYESINGSHCANLIKRLEKYNSNLKIILASATIPNPISFASRITSIKPEYIDLIKPEQSELDQSGNEIYRLLKVDEFGKSGTSSLYLQLILMLTHAINISTNPSKERILSFLDSRDLVNRFYYDFRDADSTKKLSEFRIEKLKYLSDDHYKCPVGGENNCNLDFCSKDPYPYYNGECWYGLTKAYFLNNMKAKSSSIKLSRVMNGVNDLKPDSDIIFSTSSMELGVDDPGITTIIQYRAPPSIYSFIQRKGRAGRNRNFDTSNIWFVSSNESSDRFYYNNLDIMLSQDYHIPLNPDNTYTVWVSQVLQKILEKYEQEIDRMLSYGIDEKEFSLEYTAVYSVILEYFTPVSLKDKFSKLGMNTNQLITKNEKNRFKKILDEAIYNNLKGLKVLSIENEDIFDTIAQSCNITENPEDCEKNVIKMQDSLKTDNIAEFNDAHEKLIYLFAPSLHENEKKDQAIKIFDFIIKISKLPELKNVIKRNKSIIYENKAFGEYLTSLKFSDPYYAAIHLLRAQFYWVIAHPESALEIPYEGGMPYIMPLNFFSVGDTISLKIGDEDQGETNFHDLIFRYAPHRMHYHSVENQKTKSRLALRYIVKNRNFDKVQGTTLNVQTNRITGNERLVDQNATIKYLEPTAMNLDEIYSTSENDSVKFCGKCYNLFNDSDTSCRYDNTQLETGKLFSRPIFNYAVGNAAPKEGETLYQLSKKYYNLVLLLEGENLYFTMEDFKKRKVRLNFITPFGKELTQIPVIEIKIKKLSENNAKVLENIINSKENNGNAHYLYLHSISHLYVKLVSLISGVSTEYITYYIDEIESTIKIFEMSETDTGIADSFIDSVSANPYNFSKLMKKLSECRSHETDLGLTQSKDNCSVNNKNLMLISAREANLIALKLSTDEITTTIELYKQWQESPSPNSLNKLTKMKYYDRVITCVDGCPDCIHLNNCHVRDQEESVSRAAMEMYVASLFNEINLKNFGPVYQEKIIKKEGFIYERRENSVVWFEV